MDNRRVFRQHILVTLVAPGLPWMAVIALLTSAVLFLLPLASLASWLLLLALLPVLKLFRLCLNWWAYSVVAVDGSNALTERSGIVKARQRVIPLTDFSPVMYEQPRWASILGLDMADITIATMDGRKVLPCMGDFSDLWIVIQSRGQEVPLKRPSLLVVLSRRFWRSMSVLGRWSFVSLLSLASTLFSLGRSALNWLTSTHGSWVSLADRPPQATRRRTTAPDFHFTVPRYRIAPRARARSPDSMVRRRAAHDGGYVYRETSFSPHTPSSAGLYAFFQQFIMTDGNWTVGHYEAPDSGRKYYPKGIQAHIARYYLDQLRQKWILIPVNGRERLSSRIRSVKDIQRLIPNLLEPLGKAA